MILKKIYWLFIFVFFTTSVGLADIIPTPQKIKYSYGRYRIKNNTALTLIRDFKAENIYAAEVINDALRLHLNYSSYLEKDPKDANIHLVLIDEERAKAHQFPEDKYQEAYHIKISQDLIRIEALTPKGIFYGAVTLSQMIAEAQDTTLASQDIYDWADLAIRGVSDDISRGQVSTMDNFKKVIRQMANYKMNTFMLYMEDMMQFDKYSQIGKERGALSKNEIRELVDYGKRFFVNVIPIFQTLGHQENILVNQQFENIAEFPGSLSLCVACPETYLYLENAIKEMAEAFDSEYLHIGGNDGFDVGFGKSRDLVRKNGLANVYINHFQRVYDICKKYNKKVMMYGDLALKHPELFKKLPKDIVFIDTQYQTASDYGSTNTFRNANFSYVVSPTVFNFKTTFPLHLNSLTNIQQFTKAGFAQRSIGMINSNWGDLGAETFKEFLYFSYAWSAQCAWNGKDSQIVKFSNSFFQHFFGRYGTEVEEVYQLLSNITNAITWSEFWRHPLLPFKEASWQPKVPMTSRFLLMDWSSSRLANRLDTLKKYVTKNNDHIDLLKVVAKITRYYVLKLKTQVELQNYLQKKNQQSEALIELLDDNILQLQALKTEFENAWKKYYRKEGLNYISDKFQRLILYFDEIKIAISKNNLNPSPLTDAQWLYMCDKDSTCFKESIFRKEFYLDSEPTSAKIQVMANSYAEIIVNGQTIDKVFVRNFSSIHLESLVYKYIDIKDYVKEGKNIIELKAINYNDGLAEIDSTVNTTAGVILNGYFRTLAGTDSFIKTDDTWEAKKWDKINVTEQWLKPTIKSSTMELIAPNFLMERVGWIER